MTNMTARVRNEVSRRLVLYFRNHPDDARSDWNIRYQARRIWSEIESEIRQILCMSVKDEDKIVQDFLNGTYFKKLLTYQ